MNTPIYQLRLPPYLRATIEQLRKDRTVARWIIEAIQAKAEKESKDFLKTNL